MATIEKISKGHYRITKMYKGKRYRVTLDHKPTKAEADKILYAMIDSEPSKPIYMTFEEAVNKYCNNKSSILSPATIKTYKARLAMLPETFRNTPISAITNDTIQTLLNDLASTVGAPSIRNTKIFIGVMIHSVNDEFKYKVKTPPVPKVDFYVPEDEDIQRILDYEKGGKHEIGLWLGVLGLRRSEICALETSDLSKDNIITVNKALVRDENQKKVIKITKTIESTRKVPCEPYVADLIRQLPPGRVYNFAPEALNAHLHIIQKKLGIPQFCFHKLRHYFAATAHEIGGSLYAEKVGGWKPGSDVMKKYYDYLKQKRELEANEAFIKKLSRFTEDKKQSNVG